MVTVVSVCLAVCLSTGEGVPMCSATWNSHCCTPGPVQTCSPGAPSSAPIPPFPSPGPVQTFQSGPPPPRPVGKCVVSLRLKGLLV